MVAQAAAGFAEPPRCQTSGMPPYARSHRAGTARLILNYSQSDLTGEIKARGEGGNKFPRGEGGDVSADLAGQRPGPGRAPLARRGAGVPPPPGHRGAGEAPRALPSCPADFSLGSKQLESSRNHWGGEEDVSRSWTSKNRSAP